MNAFLLTAVLSYLLGSIPFGYILVRVFRGQDVRQIGSGNIGATNVARSSGALGMATLLLDAAKGTAAFCVGDQIFRLTTLGYVDFRFYPMVCLAALSAIVGHMFPVWLKFRGGKGVATTLGAFAPLIPKPILGAIIIFLLVTLVSRYVSLGSILSAASLPLFAWLSFRNYFEDPFQRMLPIAIAAVLIILRHHQNIGRLLTHSEPRLSIGRG